jgi:hypothetical protein
MYVECIKGFLIDGFLVMQGEVFKLVEREDMIFTGVKGASLCPEMEISFTHAQLAHHFKLTLTKIVL